MKCYCDEPFYGDNCEINLTQTTTFFVVYLIHLFLFGITFLFLFIWNMACLVEILKKDKKTLFSVFTLIFMEIGTIFRLVSLFGIRGYYLFSTGFAIITYDEAFVFWISGNVFVIGLWIDLVTARNLKMGFKNAKYVIIFGLIIFFISLQTLTILNYIYISDTVITLLRLLFNIFVLIYALIVVIFPLIFGSLLLKKLNASKKITKNNRNNKLSRNTKIFMAISIFLGIFVLSTIVFVIIEYSYLADCYIIFAFQYIFRVTEIVSVAMTLFLCTGHSIKSTFKNVLEPSLFKKVSKDTKN